MCARAGVRSGLRLGSLRGCWGSLGFLLGSFGFDLGSHFQQRKPATRSQEFERGKICHPKFGAKSPTSSALEVKCEITRSRTKTRKYKFEVQISELNSSIKLDAKQEVTANKSYTHPLAPLGGGRW